ncbi:MAG: hypothetical protein K8T90_21505 [Planctomycetes bacterium]|nr:hypothetical protein [Planctomycetota bacterium]
MKRLARLVALAAFSLVLGDGLNASAVAADGAPVVNASFEDADVPGSAPVGWTLAEGASNGTRSGLASQVAVDRTVASAGKASLRLSGDAATSSWRMAQQEIAVRPRDWVALKAVARSKDVVASQGQFRNANATLEFVDAEGKRLKFVTSAVLPRDCDWTPLEIACFVPDGAVKARVGLFLSMSGTVWFDDVRFSAQLSDETSAEGRAAIFDRFTQHARRTYPFFGVAGRPQAAEWIARHRDKCIAAEGNAFFFACRALLAELNDVHVNMLTPKGPLGTAAPSNVPRNWNIEAIRKHLTETVATGRNLLAGRIGSGKDAIGYVLIGTWVRESDLKPEQLDAALDALADTKALVIDVRANGGGDEAWAAQIAGRFTSKDVVFGRFRFRDPAKPLATDAFGPPTDRVLRPRIVPSSAGSGSDVGAAKPAPVAADTRPVIVLQGPHCVSSNEAFVQMMAALPTVTSMGANTRGASANPTPFDLYPNVQITVPRWQTLTLDGTLLEGRGSDPEVRAEFPAEVFRTADPLLDAALDRLAR